MKTTIKELSAVVFEWLPQIVAGDEQYVPKEIDSWTDGDWAVVKTIIFIHGMGPLWGAYCANGWETPQMPQSLRSYLIQQYSNNESRVKKIAHLYLTVNEAFNTNNILFIPFKGIDLSSRIYNDSATRPMADIDIYVGHDKKDQIFKLMNAIGFIATVVTESGATFYPTDWLKKKDAEKYELHDNMYTSEVVDIGECPESPCSLDIHFDMGTRNMFKLSSQTGTFENARIQNDRALSNEDYFIYLLLHATKHLIARSGRWINLYDIFKFQEQITLDYEAINSKAQSLQVSHLILLPLILCRQIFKHKFYALESDLDKNIGWRHRLLLKKSCLIELSCCNPWEYGYYSMYIWFLDYRDIYDWLKKTKNVGKHTKVRKNSELSEIPSMSQRIMRRIKILVTKSSRNHWTMFATHGLNPKRDWK